MMTIITTIIVSILLGTVSPIASLGVNFPSQNLFSQISSKLAERKLSEINPLDSLGNVTAPLDNIWKALGGRLNLDIKAYSGPLKSSLAGRLSSEDTSAISQVYGVAKSAVILITNILVAVLEIALWLLKGLAGLIS